MVWIVVESWRFDTMNRENTPNIWEFGQKALVFNNHYSGGNASRFGGFSLLYGLPIGSLNLGGEVQISYRGEENAIFEYSPTTGEAWLNDYYFLHYQ